MKTMKAFIWGSAIGAALGLLFAPQRGDVTRAQLQERWNEFQSQAQTRLGNMNVNMPSSASGMIESGRQAITNTISQAQSAANTAAERAKSATNSTANTAQDRVSSNP